MISRPICSTLLGAFFFAGCGAAPAHVNPEASEKRFLLGADYFSKGLVEPALEELLQAVELNPENPDAHNLLGLLFLRKGAEAEELSTRAQCLMGEALRLEKQEMDVHFSKAEAQFYEAVRLRPFFSEALNNLAVVAIHFGHYAQAIAFEERALSNMVYREPYVARGNLGMAYVGKRDWVRAAQALRQALFEQPKFCVGRYRLAKVYYEQTEYARAQEEIDQVTADRACPIQEAYYLGGLVALQRHERQKATELFERCVELAPRSCLARECTIVH